MLVFASGDFDLPSAPVHSSLTTSPSGTQHAGIKRLLNQETPDQRKKRRQPRRSTLPSRLPIEGDDVQILAPVPVPTEYSQTIRTLVSDRASSRHRHVGHPNDIVIRFGADLVRRGSIQTLKVGKWINDEVVNAFCKHIIQPLDDEIQIFSSHFFTRLNTPNGRGPYNYGEVETWVRQRVRGSRHYINIFQLRELYVPINKDNSHWLLVRVIFGSKRIELRDSYWSGTSSRHEQYLSDMKRYLFDEYNNQRNDHDPMSWDEWDEEWECVDCSNSTPQQTNGCDCGIMMLIVISLLVQGISVTRNLYTQSMVSRQQCRLRIAYLLWRDGRI